jgi:Uma2 family endonuclease
MSLDTYWSWREQQELRYEFASGVVYAMTGTSRSHVIVVGNMFSILRAAAEANSSRCLVSTNEMALFIPAVDRVYYPDVMVACPPTSDERYETAPCLVVEVLSPSTQGRDRTVKLADYCTVPTVGDYLMVSSDPDDQCVIQHHRAGDIWVHTVHGTAATVTLSCPPITFAVADLYV